jgi:hypothetical protein
MRSLALFVLALLWPPELRAAPSAVAEPAAQWKAGAAKVVITPTEPMYLSGFADREVPAEGTAMDLQAKALAIQDPNGTRLVMVTLDLVEVAKQIRDAVAANLLKEYQLPNAALLMNCSHTHCGPELRFTDAEFAELNDLVRKERCLRYNASLVEKITRAVGQALAELEPVSLTYTHARAGFAMNRRLPTDQPTGDPYLNRPNPDGPVDHDVPVLAVERADKSLLAIVFGYACHNTTLKIKQWHGDYAGYAQRFIEEAHPHSIALFMMGCGGDQNPYPRFNDANCATHGQSLASAVEAALGARRRPVDGPLSIAYGSVNLDYQPAPTAGELQQRLAAPPDASRPYSVYDRAWDQRRLAALQHGALRDHYDYPIQVVRFGGSLTLVALSGETCVDYSLRLKRELAGPAPVWVAGYCHDIMAYIPSRRVWLEGGYEAGRAMVYWSNPLHPAKWADSLEERIVGKVHALLH